MIECHDLPYEIFQRAVLEAVVFNLKTDVTAALKSMPKEKGKNILSALLNGCLMLNPGLDVDAWIQITNSPLLVSASAAQVTKTRNVTQTRKAAVKRISRAKFLNLERHLKEIVIGQDEAIDELVSALKRSQVGLNDELRPIGVFLFSGSSGVGKSYLAKELHKYLFNAETDMIRIDCGEYQHKHENQKLIGAPPGYLGSDEGGQLVNAIEKNPNSVVLLDEVEKAHPDIWNTFLRIFDEGFLTDSHGKTVSFHNTIIILTTNLGNQETVNDLQNRAVGFTNTSEGISREKVIRTTKEAITKYFKPEFLNRIDKTIVFNHLRQEDYSKIAELELAAVSTKLEKRGFALTFDQLVIDAMVRQGVSHVQGARGLSQLRRDRIENLLADVMLEKRPPRGSTLRLTHDAEDYRVSVERPAFKKRLPAKQAPTTILSQI